jgi:hypothetical protein
MTLGQVDILVRKVGIDETKINLFDLPKSEINEFYPAHCPGEFSPKTFFFSG